MKIRSLEQQSTFASTSVCARGTQGDACQAPCSDVPWACKPLCSVAVHSVTNTERTLLRSVSKESRRIR